MQLSNIILLVTILASEVIAGSGNNGFQFTNLVVFGDSYSDESRLSYFQSHDGQAPPAGLLLPPSNNTATGGFTWNRLVADSTGAELFDYAVSGAVISNELTPRFLSSINADFPDVLSYEIPAFLADAAFINKSTGTNTLYKNRKSDNTVYALWIGTNDIGINAFFSDAEAGSTTYKGQLGANTLRDYTNAQFEVFDKLYAAGGRKFVIINLAPLQLSPLYGIPPPLGGGLGNNQYWGDKSTQNITEIAFKMFEYTTLANTIFTYQTPFEVLLAKRYPGASVSLFDVNTLINDIYNTPTEFFPGEQGRQFNVTGFFRVCDDTGSNCVDNAAPYDTFLWFDPLHPTQATMSIVAEEFIGVVNGVSKYGTTYEG